MFRFLRDNHRPYKTDPNYEQNQISYFFNQIIFELIVPFLKLFALIFAKYRCQFYLKIGCYSSSFVCRLYCMFLL